MRIIAHFENAKKIWLADDDKMIFGIDDKFFDCDGNEHFLNLSYGHMTNGKISRIDYDSEEYEERENFNKIETECSGLVSFSTIEPEYTIDDVFGNYGFKDLQGNIVIKPQYAFADEFHCGLCPVNLNRTWYKNEEGREYYENHFGYIDANGKTIIPFAFDEASIFNKYGLAIVSDDIGCYAIDTSGNVIENTRNLNLCRHFDYENRYFTFWDDNDEIDNDGLYDTKERKIFKYPSNDYDYSEHENEIISVDDYTTTPSTKYYINSDDEIVWPWLKSQKFDFICEPDKLQNTVVMVKEMVEQECNTLINGKLVPDTKYKPIYKHGLVNNKGELIIPAEYSSLYSIYDGLYVGTKDKISYIFSVL